MLPKRRNVTEERGKARLRSPAHRAWIRLHFCSVPGCQEVPVECAHVRRASTAGMGVKSSDAFCLSLCRDHHAESHRGEKTFEAKYGLSLAALAREFYEKSPYRKRLDNPYAA